METISATGSAEHPLRRRLDAAAHGRFPAVDGVAEILPLDPWGTGAVVEFTGHAYVLTNLPIDEIERFAPDGFGRATQPRFLTHLAGPGGSIGSIDAVLVRFGRGGDITVPRAVGADDHPRVRRAHQHRRDVHVYGDDRGIVCVGNGLLGRTEVSVELTGVAHGGLAGRELLLGVVDGLPAEMPVFAQVAPGNAASLRMFLACGFVPIGSEVLIERST